jgi:uracil phosphoribosyltransferase
MGIYTEDEIDTIDVTPAETTTQKTLVDQLKTKLAKPAAVVHEPEVTHAPVVATVEDLKKHSDAAKAAMAEPQSEWGKWLAESVDSFNHELDKLADKNPGDMRFRQHVRVQQVANHIVNEWVEDGTVEKATIETGGKRDNKKVAEILRNIWDTDPGDLMTSASNYLASKVIPAEAPESSSNG